MVFPCGIKIVLITVLTMLFCLPSVNAEPISRYALDVSIDIPSSEIRGTAKIEVSGGKKLTFTRGALQIHSMKLNSNPVSFSGTGRTVVVFPEGDGTLEISYSGIFRDYGSNQQQDSGVAPNVIDGSGVSLTNTWYPEAEGLHEYSLTVTLPKGYEAVSEGEDIRKTEGTDTAEFRFEFPYPVDSISLTASNRYTIKKDSYNDIQIYAYFSAENAQLADKYLDYTKKYLSLYEGMLGKFPYKRFSVVENFLPTGYSFPTFTLLGNSIIRLPFIAETSLGHEILHQWFGNHVYIDYSKGNWAEGLTTYLADHHYEEQKGKGWEYRRQVLVDYKSYVTPENEFPLKDFTGRVDSSSRVIGYGKTAMVFHMLKNTIGENAFFEALKDFVNGNRFSTAGWAELQRSFEKTSGQDLDWFFKQWIDEKGMPAVRTDEVKLRSHGRGYDLHFALNQTGKVFKFTLPLTIYTKNTAVKKDLAVDKEKNAFDFTLEEKPDRVILDENYDVLREPGEREFPPVIARLLGEKEVYVVLPDEGAERYQAVTDRFAGDPAFIKQADEIRDGDLKMCSFVVLGRDNPLLNRLFGKVSSADAGFSVLIKENPVNMQKVIMVIDAKSKDETDAAFGKITHYGKYTRLSFENGKNTIKEIEQSERGIPMDTNHESLAVDLSLTKTLQDVIAGVADKKIIYVGEMHDVFAHHAVQLDIVRGIYEKHEKTAIGMEMFQRPFQDTLDNFISGSMEEAEFLKKSEYFKRWGFDYTLYKPILDFARVNKIPVVALNLQREVIEKVSAEGIDALPEEQRKEIPADMDFSDKEYRDRLKYIFDQHKNAEKKNFDFFYQAQLLWDETMSRSTDEFLSKNPEYRIVVLAGRGHIEYGSGIPRRTFRRNGQPYASILIDSEIEKGIADYVIFPKPVEGVTAPKLMVFVEDKEGVLKITGFPENSISEKAGIKANDVVLSIDGAPMKLIDDLKIFLLYKKTGDKIRVEVLRKEQEQEEKMVFEVAL